MLVTFKIPASETPDNTIHWPNADVMLGYRPRCWANIIPTKALNHKYNRDRHPCTTSQHDTNAMPFQ